MPSPPPSAVRCPNRGWAWCAGLLLLAAVVLRVWKLGTVPGINGDEAWYGALVCGWLRGEDTPLVTPTGNPLNPCFLGPQALIHAGAEPSAALLRSIAVGSGLLAVALNFGLARLSVGRGAAWASTLVLAVLPITIAYSRFAWDACQSPAATLLAAHAALLVVRRPRTSGRWLALAIVAQTLAVWVHPTNVFTLPLLLVAVGVRWRRRWEGMFLAGERPLRRAACWGAAAILLAAGGWTLRERAIAAAERLIRPAEWAAFARGYARLFSGATVYEFIPGPPTSAHAADLASRVVAAGRDLAWIALFAGCALTLYLARRGARRTEQVLLAGVGLSLFGFFLVAGPGALAPHWERYGMGLVGPGALVLGCGLAHAGRSFGPRAVLPRAIGLAAAATLLIGFWSNYFLVFARTGGLSHRAFRTGPVEPKAAALQLIRDSVEPGQAAWIVAREWWSYWPLRYLAEGDARLRVVEWPQAAGEPDFQAALARGQAWFVDFVEPAAEPSETTRPLPVVPGAAGLVETHEIRDAAGRPALILRHYLPAGPASAWASCNTK